MLDKVDTLSYHVEGCGHDIRELNIIIKGIASLQSDIRAVDSKLRSVEEKGESRHQEQN